MSTGNTTISNELLSRLEADQLRLEWCATNQAEFYRDKPYWLVRWLDPLGEWNEECKETMAKDWRDAIDEAMRSEEEGGD